MSSKLNIAWYTRDGDLEFLGKISKKFRISSVELNSFYICHTLLEKQKLQNEFNVIPVSIGEYLDKRIDTADFSQEMYKDYEKKYPVIPLRLLALSEMYELEASDALVLKRLLLHFKFWEEFLIENSINVIVSEGPGILSTSVLWSVCKSMNIHFIEFTAAGLPGRKTFRTSWRDSIHGFDEAVAKLTLDEGSAHYTYAVDYLQKMITKPTKPPYVGVDLNTGKKISKHKSYFSFPGIPSVNKVFTFLTGPGNKRNLDNYYLKQNKSVKYKKWITSFFRLYYLKYFNVFQKNVSSQNEDYFLFPLHILNEWCDYTWMGGKYPKIDDVISECTDCLPFNTKLYVKEHPSLFPEKSLKLYRKLKKIRNVKLISPHEDTFSIINNSRGIITLGGTTGWEAFLLGKPVFLLADNWYRHLTGIYRIENSFNLAKKLQNSFDLKVATEKEKLKAIYALYDVSFEGAHYPKVQMYADDNIQKHVNALIQFMEVNVLNKIS